MGKKYRVGILGATGTVGQRFAQLLENHPQFEITAVAASDRSVGKPYSEACAWKLPGSIPASVRDIVVQPIEPPLECDIVFSSLPSSVARATEEAFARAGYPVISNSSSYRMDEDVPLLIHAKTRLSLMPHHRTMLSGCRYFLPPVHSTPGGDI